MIECNRGFRFRRVGYRVRLVGTIGYLLVALGPARLVSEVPSQALERRALVIGIDRYVAAHPRPDIPDVRRRRDLRGAGNDAEAVALLLEDRYGFAIELLLDEDATRDAILAAIEGHLIAPAKAGAEVVFYFAGHGSQIANSKSRERDGKDETLVPVDAVHGRPDIRDKELRRLFNRVLDRGARLTVILDACHSGSGVRGLPSERSMRFLDPQPGDAADEIDPGPEIEGRDALILSAAQDFELAQEMNDERGEAHGAFTLSLLRSLARAPAGESAARLFQSARSRLRALGFQQEPVIAGSPRRRAAPLFGGAVKEQRLSAAVLGVAADGRVVLQGGWADGLSTGSVLRRVSVKDEANNPVVSALRLTLVEVELTRSYARIATEDGQEADDAASLARPGDLFELEQWAVPEEASLEVRIPTIKTTADELRTFVHGLEAVADGNRVRWVHDPVAEKPTHVLDWRAGSWHLWAQRGDEQSLGGRPGVKELRQALPDEGDVRLFVHLPLTPDLRRQIRLGDGTVHDMVEKVPDNAAAIYVLTGRWRQGMLEYAWIRPGVASGDEATASLPLHTRWVPIDEKAGTTAAGTDLEDLLLRLGRIRASLTLEPPTTDLFPYRLALRESETKELKYGGAPHRRLVGGEKYGLVLRAEPKALEKPFDPLYVYVFFIDSDGKSTLVYPLGERGSVENRLPDMTGGPPPAEMEIGPQPVLEMGEPHGIDTYFLLVTSEPLPDPFVLSAGGVRGRDPRGKHPLERLFRNRGVVTRGDPFTLTPTTWSINRVSFEVIPGATDL